MHLEWTRRGRGRAPRALRIQSMAGVLSISQEERVASCEQKIKGETRFNVLPFMRLNFMLHSRSLQKRNLGVLSVRRPTRADSRRSEGSCFFHTHPFLRNCFP